MAKSFEQSSRNKKAADKIKQLRKAEHLDAMQNSSMLITMLWEDAQHRERHGYGLLPDKSYRHYVQYFYHLHGMCIGGYAEDQIQLHEENGTTHNQK